jgi:hypothetical protein
MKNMSLRLTRATPLKIARGVYRRARQGLSGLGQLEGLPGGLKLSPYVKHLRRIADQMLEMPPPESRSTSFILAPAEQVDSRPAVRPILLPDYSDLRAAPAPTGSPSAHE